MKEYTNDELEKMKNEMFGSMNAVDLPIELKAHDTRICCYNSECWKRHDCILYKRFSCHYLSEGKNVNDVKPECGFKGDLISILDGCKDYLDDRNYLI